MTITRTINGKEFIFDLTYTELWDAYKEIQHERDIAFCADIYAGWDDEDIVTDIGINRSQFEALLDEIATEMRDRIDNYGWGVATARSAAINTIVFDHYGIEPEV